MKYNIVSYLILFATGVVVVNSHQMNVKSSATSMRILN